MGIPKATGKTWLGFKLRLGLTWKLMVPLTCGISLPERMATTINEYIPALTK